MRPPAGARSSTDAGRLQDADPQARRARHADLPLRAETHETFDAFFVVDSFVDRVVDAVGAGDALLAYATLALLATGNDGDRLDPRLAWPRRRVRARRQHPGHAARTCWRKLDAVERHVELR